MVRLLSPLFVMALFAAPVTAQSFTATSNPSATIVAAPWGSGSPTNDEIDVPSSFFLQDVQCGVQITGSPTMYFLTVELTSPAGTTVILSNFNCGGLSSVTNMFVTLGTSTNPFDASHLNDGYGYVMEPCGLGTSMDDFDGEDGLGAWRLDVWNDGTSGTLEEWVLTLSDSTGGPVAPGNDTCATPVEVLDPSVTPFDATAASASGAEDCTGVSSVDVWYSFEAECTADYTFSTCGSSFDTRIAVYAGACPVPGSTAVGCGDDECGLQSEATVPIAAGDTVLIQVSAAPGSTAGAGEFLVTSNAAPTNDFCADPITITDAVTAFDTTCATTSGIDPGCAGTVVPPIDIWFTVTAECTGTLIIDTFGSDYDTMLAAWAGSACPTGAPIVCNDNTTGGGSSSRSEIELTGVTQGDVFLVQVSGGFVGASGTGVVNVTCDGVIVVDPTFRRGDSNDDSMFDISDAVFTLSALFSAGSPAPSCVDAADSNDDGSFDISDAIHTLGALFQSGSPQPGDPGPTTCGVDPTPDGLDCVLSVNCP